MMSIDNLEFEPLSRHMSCGNEVQLAKTVYKGVEILERTYFPWNPLKDSTVFYTVDLVFPIGTMDCLADWMYTEEGFGVPHVDTLEKAIEIIDNFKAQSHEYNRS